jgi:hypothetical protein
MSDDKEARRRQLSGVAFMCLGVFAFTFQDLIIKGISTTYPAHQIVFIRSLLALPFTLAIAHFENGLHRLNTPRIGAHMLRGTVFFLAYTLYYLGIAALPLAMAVAISFAAPLFITALAGPLLGEKVGKIRWLAVILGFLGVLIVMRDGLGMLEWAVVLPALSALCYALGQLHGRHIGATESASTMSVYVNVMFFLLEPSKPRFPAQGLDLAFDPRSPSDAGLRRRRNHRHLLPGPRLSHGGSQSRRHLRIYSTALGDPLGLPVLQPAAGHVDAGWRRLGRLRRHRHCHSRAATAHRLAGK